MMNLLPSAIEELADQILPDVIESFASRLKARTEILPDVIESFASRLKARTVGAQ